MNIYCVIFMCSFGSNQTDTEISSHNSLTSNHTRTTGIGSGTDVASMILPERGEPVPNFGVIVMDLPEISTKKSPPATAQAQHPQHASNKRVVVTSGTDRANPTLAEILLPPSPAKKMQEDFPKLYITRK